MGQNILSFKAASVLSAYRGVGISAANTVDAPASNQVPYVGVLKDEVVTAGDHAQIAGIGERAKLFFNDTCAVGGLVGLDSSGRGVPFTLSNTTTSLTLTGQYIGILLGAAVAATGTIAEILVQPSFVRASS